MATTQSGKTPKEAQVVAQILTDMGIQDYEPRVINQLLEFTYKYVTTILDDAKIYSSHAKKKSIDVDDIKLAVQMQLDRSFTTPPPRDVLLEIAKTRNSSPLPLIKSHSGLRLPPDRFCFTSNNYRLKSFAKPQPPASQGLFPLKSGQSSLAGAFSSKFGASKFTGSKTQSASASVPTIGMAKPGVSKVLSAAKPIIKFTAPGSSSQSIISSSDNKPSFVVVQSGEQSTVKRKYEETD